MVNCLTVNFCQRGNALLHHLEKGNKWSYGTTQADYEYRGSTVIIYIQLRYLLAHRDYLESRLSQFMTNSPQQIRVCLCFHDIHDVAENLMVKVNALCLKYEFSLLCAYSLADVAKYITSLGRESDIDVRRALRTAEKEQLPLPKIKGLLNEKDIRKVMTVKGTLAEVFRSSAHDLSLVPGIRPARCQLLWKIFNSPFGGKSPEVSYADEYPDSHLLTQDESFARIFGTQVIQRRKTTSQK
ncbi:elongation factor-1 gamma [Perkinsela sp. CCAP 1560/4]|nr:elongation factor-1 gamma [Perkinsela sp. CCAP 1560/4]|eukprot:KNH08060.1 elongation factor-1 gamma [Perkinsela sp. CCAP 1560/4]